MNLRRLDHLRGGLFFVVATFSLFHGTKSSEADANETTLQRVLQAIDKGLDFLLSEYTKVNLDAIIGTRLVEGQLAVLLNHLEARGGPHVSKEILDQIQVIHDKADHVSNLATPIVRESQATYYNRIGPILRQGFWTLDYASRDIDRSRIRAPSVDGEAMHEDDSDNCLTELFGTGERKGQSCHVSRRCWDLMTGSGYKGYSLSHEVFYLEIGQQFGCFDARRISSLDDLNSDFCANMYAEGRYIAAKGFPLIDQDYFMELPALCGILGYRQFFRDDWLDKILSWQWPRGCWGTTEQLVPRSAKDRFKREEKRFPDGCQCHRTSVALGALVQYVRYIIEFMNKVGQASML